MFETTALSVPDEWPNELRTIARHNTAFARKATSGCLSKQHQTFRPQLG